jgi:predicted oxidoreductase
VVAMAHLHDCTSALREMQLGRRTNQHNVSCSKPSPYTRLASHALYLCWQLEGVEAAATNMGVRAVDLRQELEQYDAEVAAAAAAGGATVDSAVESGHKRFGKHVFPSRVLGSGADGPLWLALVTPVVHYCMGGLQIGPDAEVLDADGAPLRGVWAAGEAAGGLHGKNRLGGQLRGGGVRLGLQQQGLCRAGRRSS